MRYRVMVFLLLPVLLSAQETTDMHVKRHFVITSLSAGAGSRIQEIAAGAYHGISMGRFSVYYGPRYSVFFNQNKTIPDRGNKDQQLAISPTGKTHHILNLAVGAQYQVKKLLLGFNIDITGITLNAGSRYTLTYTLPPPDEPLTVQAETYRFNLLTGVRDRGALNSEFYAGYRFTDRLSVKAGLCHFFVQYAQKHATSDNNTGRVFYNLPFVATTYVID
jgi:hypothetical protein